MTREEYKSYMYSFVKCIKSKRDKDMANRVINDLFDSGFRIINRNRCVITGNIVGTDTVIAGSSCDCVNCSLIMGNAENRNEND